MKAVYIMILLSAIVMCFCGCGEHKTAWLEFSRDPGATCFYTLEKMSRDESSHLVKVWVKTLFNEKRHQGEDEVAYAKNLFFIKCREKTYRVNVGFYFNSANKIVSKTDEEQSQEMTLLLGKTNVRAVSPQPVTAEENAYRTIVPGSPVDHLRAKVCR